MEKLIVIVEDEPNIAELYEEFLQSEGYRIQIFLDASDLFTFLKSTTPDLIILDYMLPNTTGVKISKSIDPKIPIIMISGIPEFIEQTSFEVISKPFNEDILIQKIEKIISSNESKAS